VLEVNIVVLCKKLDRPIQFLAYCIVIAAFLISIAFPLVLQYTAPYGAPPAANSIWIVTNGHLVETNSYVPPPHVYWRSAIDTENQYPVSSIMLSVLMLISSIPFQYAVFIPLASIGNIVYFVLARYILKGITSNKSYVLLFSALYYLFFVSCNLQATTSGRAVLGLTLFTFFLYIYLRFSRGGLPSKFQHDRFWSVVALLLIGIAIGNAYYMGTVDIIGLMLLMIAGIALTRNVFPRKRWWLEFSIMILLIFLFLGKNTLTETSHNTSLSDFFSNIVQYFGTMFGRLGIKLPWVNTAPTQWAVQLVSFDPIIIFWQRFSFFIQYSSIIAIIVCLISYRPRKYFRSPKSTVWLFSVFLLFASLGELSYFTTGPAGAERLLLMYGPIVTLSLIIMFPLKGLKSRQIRQICMFLVIVLLCFGIWGEVQFAWVYGRSSGRPFAYNNVYSVSDFLCNNSASNKPFILGGDAYYTAQVFFITSLNNKTVSVIPEPLGADAITLHMAMESGNLQDFLSAMYLRQINYLLIVDDGRPLWGDGWGYMIDEPNTDALTKLQFSPIYDDGRTQLFHLPPN